MQSHACQANSKLPIGVDVNVNDGLLLYANPDMDFTQATLTGYPENKIMMIHKFNSEQQMIVFLSL